MVGGDDDDRVIELARGLDLVDEAAELVVDLGDGRVVAGRGFLLLALGHAREDALGLAVEVRSSGEVVVPVGLGLDGVDIVALEELTGGDVGVVGLGDANEAAPGLAALHDLAEVVLGEAHRYAHAASFGGLLMDSVEEHVRVPFGPRDVVTEGVFHLVGVLGPELPSTGLPRVGAARNIGLPAEPLQLL